MQNENTSMCKFNIKYLLKENLNIVFDNNYLKYKKMYLIEYAYI